MSRNMCSTDKIKKGTLEIRWKSPRCYWRDNSSEILIYQKN